MRSIGEKLVKNYNFTVHIHLPAIDCCYDTGQSRASWLTAAFRLQTAGCRLQVATMQVLHREVNNPFLQGYGEPRRSWQRRLGSQATGCGFGRRKHPSRVSSRRWKGDVAFWPLSPTLGHVLGWWRNISEWWLPLTSPQLTRRALEEVWQAKMLSRKDTTCSYPEFQNVTRCGAFVNGWESNLGHSHNLPFGLSVEAERWDDL